MEYVLVFKDTNSAIAAERCLLEAGAGVSVMPLPESIGSGCGITLRVDGDSLDHALGLLRENSVDLDSVYSREKTAFGYKYIEETDFKPS